MPGFRRLLIGIALLGAAAFGARWLLDPGLGSKVVDPASRPAGALFAARFVDAGGTLQPLAQWRGRVLVINFWATWCPPCLDEMPELSALQDKYRAAGLTIVGISTDDVVKIREFSRTTPVSYPLLAGDIEAMNLAQSLGNDKGVLPYSVIVGRDGELVEKHLGRIDPAALEASLLPLLKPGK